MPGGGNPLPDDLGAGAYGTKYKQEARRYYGSFMGFACRGEMIPNDDCFAELDDTVKDKWGVPVLKWHWKWAEHEQRMCDHAELTFRELIETMGGTVRTVTTGRNRIDPGGKIIHEVGGAIMGSERNTSVCNGFNQTWEVKNLFLVDGTPFPSNADKNPTLTIMALAWRAGDYLVEQSRRGLL